MQSAIWKIAALLSVMGIGGYVVVKVHNQLPVQTAGSPDPKQFKPPAASEGAGSDADSSGQPTFELGAASENGPTGAWDLPPADQDEPGSGQAERRLASADHSAQPQFSADAAGGGSPFSQFDHASQTADPSADSVPLTAENPFAGSSLHEEHSTADADHAPHGAPLMTADARLAAPTNDVEQVGAAGADPDELNNNPFAFAGGTTDAETATTDAAEPEPFSTFGQQTEPTGPEIVGADPQLTFDPVDAGRTAQLESTSSRPALAAADDPTVSGGDAFDSSASYDPTTTDPSLDPGFDAAAAAADEPSPLLELGPTIGESPATAELEPQFEPDPTGTFVPDLTTDATYNPASSVESGPASGVEPSRFPAVADDSPAPKTALRTREFVPLQPAQDEPPFQIIPNPVAGQDAARSPRPEFVGEATLDADTAPGPQQPELTIQKVAPTDATVGDPLVYAIKVKNVGSSTAHDVIVEDRIPRGTTLEGSIPQAELTDKKLIWQLGHMAPGDEKTIRIKVVPTEPGEIGSVATVRFVAEVAATTRITTPSLTMDVQGPAEVAVGEPVVFQFRIANIGEGEARNVYLRNLLPAGFEHPGGRDIEYDVGSLKPGQSREIDLSVTAAQEGVQSLTAQLNTGTTTRAEQQSPVKVIKSRLLIQRHGPKQRFVGRPADYTTVVSNRSSSPLQRIQVVEQLPAGMELGAVPEGGHFDPQRRTITWRITELAPGAQTTFKTSVIASRQGTMEGVVSAVDAAGNKAQLAAKLDVIGFASLTVDLEHDGRPVGVGEQVALRLTVKNRGTSAAEDVRAEFDIPRHLQFVNADGPVGFELEDGKVTFAAIESLAADEEQTFDIRLTAAAPGTTPVTAKLFTSDGADPLQHTERVNVEGDAP